MNKQNFHYEDGAEKKLFEIFQSNNHKDETIWYANRNVWNLHYHLSPERKNILNWGLFEDEEELDVLELGSGCGAITEALVEMKGISTITCVEGEEKRHEISKLRLRDTLKKINFVHSNISDFTSEHLFDVVIVIGVLEYSGKYIHCEHPYEAFLNMVCRFLKPDGRLVLAIENQLGHKYLAGANEDHYQQPYVGISNYQNDAGMRTFTKHELMSKLTKTGLEFQKFYYPFPDYKMPKVILSEDCFQKEGFDWLALLDFPSDGHAKRPNYRFNEKAFLQLIRENADPGIFMNSFLIVASAREMKRKETTLLAAKMNTTRHVGFRTIKSFVDVGHGEIKVDQRNPLSAQVIRSDYRKHSENLGELFVDAILSENADKVREYLGIWNSILDQERRVLDEKTQQITDIWSAHTSIEFSEFYADETLYLGSHCLDLIPQNILKHEGRFQVIDLEWKLNCDVFPKSLILDRGIFWMVNKVIRISGRSGEAISLGNWNVPESIQHVLPMHDPSSLKLFEDWFQCYVYTGEEGAYERIPQVIREQNNPFIKLKNWSKEMLRFRRDQIKKWPRMVRVAQSIAE